MPEPTSEIAIPDDITALVPAGLKREVTTGITLWLQNYSCLAASKASGCPNSTLWEQLRKLPEELTTKRASYADAAEDLVFPLIHEAARQTGEMLTEGRYKPMEVATVLGITLDKMTRLRQVAQGSTKPSDLGDLLTKLVNHGGGAVTLSVETNATKTIDVTARESEE